MRAVPLSAAWFLLACPAPPGPAASPADTPPQSGQDAAAAELAETELPGADAPAPPGAPPALGEPVVIVPSDRLGPGILAQNANNNLDIVDHEGRLFLAFRTAPTHFASAQTRLFVASTVDEETYDFEAEFHLDTDLREPRFLAWKGGLWLYFAVLGKSSADFQPQGARMSRYLGRAQWADPVAFHSEADFLPWRARVVGGLPALIGYTGGGSIYDLESTEPILVHWLTTQNGKDWVPFVPSQPVVSSGGGSETDLAILADGSLVAVTRNEKGDDLGWGSKICRAPAAALGAWECKGDKKKYDSPLLFLHEGVPYLLARRNLTETGNYDLEIAEGTAAEKTVQYLFDYSNQPKRCALWRVDPEGLAVSHVLDLPSRGDTCFPGLVQRSPKEYAVYNYTSPLEGPDLDWIDGQVGPTRIYRMTLTFP